MAGILYIVSTPVGNLEDITLRAIRVLKEVDLVACEDTRHAKKLLTEYGIDTRTASYHEHNEEVKSEQFISELMDSKDIAIISDAGTPSISDPGFRLIREAISNNITVVPVPGPSSVIAALTVSGLPTDSFCFLGFLPRTEQKLESFLADVEDYPGSIIIYESARRIQKSLEKILDILGDRRIAVCRELTKLYEEVIRGRISDVVDNIREREFVKGEITVVIEGLRETDSTSELKDVSKRLKSLKDIDISLKDAVKVVNEDFDMPKKRIYSIALDIWGK